MKLGRNAMNCGFENVCVTERRKPGVEGVASVRAWLQQPNSAV